MLKDPAPVILWFRQDLRLADNPALQAARASGRPIIPLYVFDAETDGKWARGAASRWWLHHSLLALRESLGGTLVFRIGRAETILPQLIKKTGAVQIYANRVYEGAPAAQDAALRENIPLEILTGALLFEPEAVRKKDGTSYRVFTPYYRAGRAQGVPDTRSAAPRKLNLTDGGLKSETPDLLPRIRWHTAMDAFWTPGEKGAWTLMRGFKQHAARYGELHNRPDEDGTSRLSPHLHFGEISPVRLWHEIGEQSEAFRRQLVWRNFAYLLLTENPDMPDKALRPGRRAIDWLKDAKGLKAWQKGLTGYPVVDAGMRQLWSLGWMHNRVRLITGSFLVKDLLIDWRTGEDWFWDCLVDADLANNAQNWQWVAGCGVDASPFFRIFNPTTQGKKFDPKGDYVRAWVPELKNFPARHIHAPHDAPDEVWTKAGLARDAYPRPIVDHDVARQRALAALRAGRESY